MGEKTSKDIEDLYENLNLNFIERKKAPIECLIDSLTNGFLLKFYLKEIIKNNNNLEILKNNENAEINILGNNLI
jgi:hypothetical protein